MRESIEKAMAHPAVIVAGTVAVEETMHAVLGASEALPEEWRRPVTLIATALLAGAMAFRRTLIAKQREEAALAAAVDSHKPGPALPPEVGP